MGYILSVTLDVTVRFSDGAVARVPRATADDITPVRESDRMREAPNPGMKVRGSGVVWANAIWEKGSYADAQRRSAIIIRVRPGTQSRPGAPPFRPCAPLRRWTRARSRCSGCPWRTTARRRRRPSAGPWTWRWCLPQTP